MKVKVCKECGLTYKSSRKLIDTIGCSICKEKLRLRRISDSKYRASIKDEISAYLKQWRVSNQEIIIDYRIKYKQQYQDKLKDRRKKYRVNNPDKIAALNAKRRAAKLKRIPSWSSASDIKYMEALYSSTQRITRCTGIQFHVDHIIPLQGQLVSGLHTPSNLQIISSYLNLSKHNKFHD